MLEITEDVTVLEELPETESVALGHEGHEGNQCNLVTCLIVTCLGTAL